MGSPCRKCARRRARCSGTPPCPHAWATAEPLGGPQVREVYTAVPRNVSFRYERQRLSNAAEPRAKCDPVVDAMESDRIETGFQNGTDVPTSPRESRIAAPT